MGKRSPRRAVVKVKKAQRGAEENKKTVALTFDSVLVLESRKGKAKKGGKKKTTMVVHAGKCVQDVARLARARE